ncbi:MAG TPA: TonB-dependent receptor [Desulfocapsa sulfexigens]|nr:TonB-dependent receptor [Desulfocapsa sulfexigens]
MYLSDRSTGFINGTPFHEEVSMFKKSFITLLITLSAVTSSLAAEKFSDEDLFNMDLQELMKIEIFAMGEVQPRTTTSMDESTRIFEVTAQDIASQNARTIGDALRFVPGLFLSRGMEGSSAVVFIRGAKKTPLVMIDNRPVAEPQQGLVAWDQFPIDNVAKIKIIKGPSSAAYGANSLNGVINIITKKGKGKPNSHIQYQESANSTKDIWAESGGEAGLWNYYITASYRRSDGFDLSDDFHQTPWQTSSIRRESDYERKNISMNLGRDIGADSSVAVLAGLYRSADGIMPFADKPTFYHRRWQDWQRGFLDLTGKTILFNKINVRGKFYYDQFSNEMIFFKQKNFPEYQFIDRISDFDNATIGGNIHLNWLCGENLKMDVGSYIKNNMISTRLNEHEQWQEEDLTTIDFFIESRWSLLDNLDVTLGLNYDTFTGTEESNNHLSSWNPRFFIHYQPLKKTTMHIAYGRKSRFPVTRELESENGNPSNSEVHGDLYEIGLQQLLWQDCLSLGFIVFQTNTDDVISRDYNNWWTTKYENRYEQHYHGIELSASARITDRLNLSADYSYTDTRVVDDGEEFRLNETTYHQINGRLNYISDFGMAGFIQLAYSSGLYDFETDKDLDDFTLINAKLTYSYKQFTPFLAVENLLDENYVRSVGYPQAGRTFTIGISANF